MQKCKLPILWLPIVFFGLIALACFALPGYRFSGLVCLGIIGVILCYRLLFRLEKQKLIRILTVVLCVFLLAYAVTGAIIIGTPKIKQEREATYLIVLGAGVNGTVPSLSLRNRLDATLVYLQEHPKARCIVSGGQGSGENITEAECMYRYLTAAGIDPARIIKEEQATSTQENLRYSMALIPTVNQTSVGIISSEYHLYRAGCMARDQGFDPILIPAETTRPSLRMNYYMREVVALWYYLLIGG